VWWQGLCSPGNAGMEAVSSLSTSAKSSVIEKKEHFYHFSGKKRACPGGEKEEMPLYS